MSFDIKPAKTDYKNENFEQNMICEYGKKMTSYDRTSY